MYQITSCIYGTKLTVINQMVMRMMVNGLRIALKTALTSLYYDTRASNFLYHSRIHTLVFSFIRMKVRYLLGVHILQPFLNFQNICLKRLDNDPSPSLLSHV